MTRPIRLAVIGLGKIAHDQHLPAITADPAFSLVATVSPGEDQIAGLPHFTDIAGLVASGLDVDAVSLCTPPQVRRAIAIEAIDRGWHVFLEKPPATTLAEVEAMREAAVARQVSLFASWHSRAAPVVEPARRWLADRAIRRATITWREDVRTWHPGQDWIFEAGGLGVFDPGINALSIATRIMPRPLFVDAATTEIPANRAAPIAAHLDLRDGSGVPIMVDLDFRQEGRQRWDIEVETDDGVLLLERGGASLTVDGVSTLEAEDDLGSEYARLYHHFAALIRAGKRDIDISPLRLVADSFLRAHFRQTDAFHW